MNLGGSLDCGQTIKINWTPFHGQQTEIIFKNNNTAGSAAHPREDASYRPAQFQHSRGGQFHARRLSHSKRTLWGPLSCSGHSFTQGTEVLPVVHRDTQKCGDSSVPGGKPPSLEREVCWQMSQPVLRWEKPRTLPHVL